MTIYTTGTVSVTNGSAVVAGSGTAWAVALIAGGMFSSAGVSVPILSVDSDTSLTLAYAWPGTTAAGAVYAIARENSEAADIVNLNDRLSQVLVKLSLIGIHPDNSGTLAKRDALTLHASDDNYIFLRAELGVEFAFYRWDGPTLTWIGPFTVADAVAGGGVTSIVAGTNVTIDSTNPAIPVISATGTPVETAVHAAASKATPVDADEMALVDSAASFGLKKLTWANLKSTLKSNLALREVLTANRTYYVRTDGSDSNNGLANTAGGAFKTIQRAINVVASLDLSIFNVTIQCGNSGTYDAVTVSGPFTGSGTVTILGDGVTPSNVVIPSVTCTGAGSKIRVGSCKFSGVTQLIASNGGSITIVSAVEFGTATNYHMQANGFGSIISLSGISYTVSGGAVRHCYSLLGGYIELTSAACAISGTPAFSFACVDAQRLGAVSALAFTFTGSATGARYSATINGIIYTGGGGASFFPGSVAGSTGTGGQYA